MFEYKVPDPKTQVKGMISRSNVIRGNSEGGDGRAPAEPQLHAFTLSVRSYLHLTLTNTPKSPRFTLTPISPSLSLS
jgi:hypothetical protein